MVATLIWVAVLHQMMTGSDVSAKVKKESLGISRHRNRYSLNNSFASIVISTQCMPSIDCRFIRFVVMFVNAIN